MKKLRFLLSLLFFFLIFVSGCQNNDNKVLEAKKVLMKGQKISSERTYEETLPEGIKWLTNNEDSVYSSPKAQKGGVYHGAMLGFPMTFRVVGPDSNHSFRGLILDNQLSLIGIHPNTENIIPELATHWAFDDDKKTMYFKLDPKAKWSDGKPVTAWDYVYTLKFMRSEHIVAPWYNDYYSKEIDKVIVYDDHTIAIKSPKAVPELYLRITIGPIPEHFYGNLNMDFVQEYNWKIVPNTGAYQISDFKKGKFIKFKRKKDWWAKDNKYFKNRFNTDYVVYTVIRDMNLTWEYFKKGKLDTFALNFPKYWHQKSDIDIFKNGYVNKIWFFNDMPQPSYGMWLNQKKEIFQDKDIRYAFAHAINMEKVLKNILRNDYLRLPQAFYGYGRYTDYTIKAREFDIAKVESLMNKSGWNRGKDGIWEKDGLRFSVEVTYTSEEHTPRLAVLKEEALKAGIELRLQRLDPSASYKKVLEKEHEVAWSGWGFSSRPSYWQGWHSDNANKTQTNNITNTAIPELDDLIIKYRDSLDIEKRITLSKIIQRKIHETGAYVPTYMLPYTRHAYWKWVMLPKFYGTKSSEVLFDPFNSGTGGLFWIDDKVKEDIKKAKADKKPFNQVIIKDESFKAKVQN